jgi:hypothetical protein
MMRKNALRRSFRYVQKLSAPPDRVFPLLCPTREYEWIGLWSCDLIYSDSGFAELGCIFMTDFKSDPGPEIWVISSFEKNRTIGFTRTSADYVILHTITLIDGGEEGTDAVVDLIYTTLTERGEEYIDSLTVEAFEEEQSTLEGMLNHYLMHGSMLRSIEDSEMECTE